MAEQERCGVMEVREDGPVTIVTLEGEVDLNRAPQMKQTLEAACSRRPNRLVLDLSEVGYMDSSGVGTLVWVYREVQRYGGRFILVGAQDKVKAVLQITQLEKFFTMLDSVDEALKA